MKRSLTADLNSWKHLENRKPLILRGARQVGKTYLLKEFAQSEFPASHYFNFEKTPRLKRIFEADLAPQRILDELTYEAERPIDIRRDLLIFDEIQIAPNAITSLKYFAEELPELAICAAGSLLGLALNETSFPVGKVNFLELFPLSFFEWLEASGKTQLLELATSSDLSTKLPESAHTKLWDLWKSYLVTGGLPEVVMSYLKTNDSSFTTFERVRRKQEELLLGYLADISKHSGKISAMNIERLFRNVPEQLARPLDGQAEKFKFRDAIPGMRGFNQLSGPLDWLEKAGLTLKTPIASHAAIPLSAYCKENAFKLYLFDIGILGSLAQLSPRAILDYAYGTYKGYVAENYVAQELRANGVRQLHCWNEKESELEFLIEAESTLIPIEVKSGRALRSRSMQIYDSRYTPKLKIKLSANNTTREGRNLSLPIYLAGRLPNATLNLE